LCQALKIEYIIVVKTYLNKRKIDKLTEGRIVTRENRGRFIKPCPGTPGHVCCGYQIINYAQGCNLGCTYCILNYYFKKSPITIFSNISDLFLELENFLHDKRNLTRFGTGEFTDSLLFESYSSLYDDLIPYISQTHNAVLEIKTKTVNIQRLLKIKQHNNTIVSWSLNSDYMAKKEERCAPPIEKRLKAAYRIQEEGYKLSFHFDPIVAYDSWEDGYRKTIDKLLQKIKPENIVYISMGTLRYIKEMKELMIKEKASYLNGEFIRGLDGKMRYFRPLRTMVYRRIKSYLQEYVDKDILYMCMESPDVWKDVFGIGNMKTEKLTKRLDEACYRKFKRLIK